MSSSNQGNLGVTLKAELRLQLDSLETLVVLNTGRPGAEAYRGHLRSQHSAE